MPVNSANPAAYVIQGVTRKGKTFRPSDWSERLAGAMSSFGPRARGVRKADLHLRYSLYVSPMIIGNLKCVVLDARLRDIAPYAFDFVLRFAKDNDLVVESQIQAAK
ncbi:MULTISPECIES: DUF3579 domain-containing protein [unclassified Paraburkholderia]|uniref:DUF3579 domain-containing protein n=1 Tax=unclassified Paraburkholderia TaxID=2615204 RepID=UPI002AB004B9|nr:MULTISPECIES: DUF3579 domain-containing protein [unclassified Paraburkholderia]